MYILEKKLEIILAIFLNYESWMICITEDHLCSRKYNIVGRVKQHNLLDFIELFKVNIYIFELNCILYIL